MATSLLSPSRPSRPTARWLEPPPPPEDRTPARAGQIGPIRRKIVFEPVHEQPAPGELTPVEPPGTPETQPREPVPDRS
jgi:hypothetical protein